MFLNKAWLILITDSAASNEAHRKLTYFLYLPWPPLETGLLIATLCFLFIRSRKLLFIYTLLLISLSPKEIILHQTLSRKRTIFNIYSG